MAIDAVYLDLISQVVKSVKNEKSIERISALCVAYPDLLVPQNALDKILGPQITDGLSVRADAQSVWSWHGLPGCDQPLYETAEVFDRIGVTIDVVDIVQARGIERLVDLNSPLPADMNSKYDLVIDTGTCEHCFNVGQAFLNCCSSVAAGGYFIHAAPLNKPNHGFWNFSPTVYPDFLMDNGFEINFIAGVKGSLQDGFKTFDLELFSRSSLPQESMVYLVAKRLREQALIWPVQRKYRKNK